MELSLDSDLAEFRQMVRTAIAEDLPEDMRRREMAYGGMQSEPADCLAFTRILAKRGWSVPHWPVEYGGQPWTPLQKFVFEDELCDGWTPEKCWGATFMVGPVIYTFGTEALKEQFLPGIRNGDCYWAQGFSEPGNGSDLATLRTSAVLKGDKYIVNGQKNDLLYNLQLATMCGLREPWPTKNSTMSGNLTNLSQTPCLIRRILRRRPIIEIISWNSKIV
jgi:alkylation response protein AidB-like acyl-CoA dehydrogenase